MAGRHTPPSASPCRLRAGSADPACLSSVSGEQSVPVGLGCGRDGDVRPLPTNNKGGTLTHPKKTLTPFPSALHFPPVSPQSWLPGWRCQNKLPLIQRL
ncbi:hypothetical protein AAFF_G00394060 [Aldrovandia affinis]|uniref:Uncharacterized protein n=1 Tax=Aldrovandia affinis TaxID=143900 RepID=A0AAD7SDP0_9TELE|nr:hypothetical protein AAFF_G00394060 [Aldrovandia affinis]